MSVYLDASALVRRYVSESGTELVHAIMADDPDWVTGRHTWVEVWLALGRILVADGIVAQRQAFERDWRRTMVVEIDHRVCSLAGHMGDSLGLRTLDALHLACADRVGSRSIPLVTFDLRLAAGARSIGFTVVGS